MSRIGLLDYILDRLPEVLAELAPDSRYVVNKAQRLIKVDSDTLILLCGLDPVHRGARVQLGHAIRILESQGLIKVVNIGRSKRRDRTIYTVRLLRIPMLKLV